MVIGIVILMAVIAIFWVFNISSFINPYSERVITTDQESLNWDELKGEFDNTMSKVGQKMDEIEVQKQATDTSANASSSLDNLENALSVKINESKSGSSSSVTSTDPAVQSVELKARLEDMEKSLNKK